MMGDRVESVPKASTFLDFEAFTNVRLQDLEASVRALQDRVTILETEADEPPPPEPEPPPPEPPPDAGFVPLEWERPILFSPTEMNLTQSVGLSDSKDYILRLPANRLDKSITITGGKNLLIVGGHIAPPDVVGKAPPGLKFKHTKGQVHVEGVLFGKSNTERSQIDGIVTIAPDCELTVQRCHFAGLHHSGGSGHPDFYHNQGGVKRIRFADCTGYNNFQGFQIAFPHSSGEPRGRAEFLRIDANFLYSGAQSSRRAGVFWWIGSGLNDWETNCASSRSPVRFTDCWINPGDSPHDVDEAMWVFPSHNRPTSGACRAHKTVGNPGMIRWTATEWEGEIMFGRPPGGEFCPAERVGLAYPRLDG